MKLNKFKEKKNKTKYFLMSGLTILGVGGVFILGNSFGKYQVEKSFSIINGQIQANSSDVSIATINVDGQPQDKIPENGTGIYFDNAECSNGATGSWDRTNWQFILSSTKKTKCTLNFTTSKSTTGEQSGSSKMEDLLEQNQSQEKTPITSDDNNNIRYIGSDTNNYVYFNCKNGSNSGENCETWRIIGLMDGIKTSSGKNERLLKIIRKDSLGNHSWDKSDNVENNIGGVNEWSHSDLMHALKNYGGESDSECKDTSCNSWGQLSTSAQSMIEDVIWNTGTSPGTENMWQEVNSAIVQYMWERSAYTGKQCTQGETFCNDLVVRQATWEGKVGLMYPSDYGYATDGGGTKSQRNECIGTKLYNGKSLWWPVVCYNNDWLRDSNNQWTMTSAPHSSDARYVFYVNSTSNNGSLDYDKAYVSYAIRPVVYLKSSVKITGGDGSSTSPYKLSVQ